MKKHCIIMTCVCFLVLSMFAHADAVRLSKDYLFKDMPVTSVADNAKIDALLFNSSNSNIYGQILVPNTKFAAPRPVVLMFHGFAGFTRWDDVGHALCQAGAVVVIPHLYLFIALTITDQSFSSSMQLKNSSLISKLGINTLLVTLSILIYPHKSLNSRLSQSPLHLDLDIIP